MSRLSARNDDSNINHLSTKQDNLTGYDNIADKGLKANYSSKTYAVPSQLTQDSETMFLLLGQRRSQGRQGSLVVMIVAMSVSLCYQITLAEEIAELSC